LGINVAQTRANCSHLSLACSCSTFHYMPHPDIGQMIL
jgi:hypothetical protein